MNIIKRIKMYCTLTGIGVAEIHARTGLSRQTVYRIWQREICTTDTLETLLNSLDLSIILKKTEKKLEKEKEIK